MHKDLHSILLPISNSFFYSKNRAKMLSKSFLCSYSRKQIARGLLPLKKEDRTASEWPLSSLVGRGAEQNISAYTACTETQGTCSYIYLCLVLRPKLFAEASTLLTYLSIGNKELLILNWLKTKFLPALKPSLITDNLNGLTSGILRVQYTTKTIKTSSAE